MTQETPLSDVHRRLGAHLVDFAGWLMPLKYGSEIAEHRAVRQGVGLFDLSHMGEIEVAGPDAAASLDYSLVNRPSAIKINGARYSMMCDEDGGIIDDLVVYRTAAESFLVVANAGNAEEVARALTARAADHATRVTNASAGWALIAVQGPRSAAVLRKLMDAEFVDSLKYYTVAPHELAGMRVLIARTGYTGEDGFELYVAAEWATNLWDLLMEVGQTEGIVPAGLASRDSLRLEAGMPLYGNELTRETTPFDAGLGRLVALDKPEGFVGHEALRERKAQPPTRTLVGLVSDGRRAPRHGYQVLNAEGAPVGAITSGAPSPTLGHAIAMAYVDPRHGEVGAQVQVDIRGRHQAASVVELPFYRRTK
jgi:aminomethyltransferase